VGFEHGFDSDFNEVLLLSNGKPAIKIAGEKKQIAKEIATYLFKSLGP